MITTSRSQVQLRQINMSQALFLFEGKFAIIQSENNFFFQHYFMQDKTVNKNQRNYDFREDILVQLPVARSYL